MNRIILLIFLAVSTSVSATTYYVSSSGDDSANGLSELTPWKTLEKVNTAFSSIKPGDKILLKRGDSFYGTLKLSASGVSENPIVISSYGTGNNPVIYGFTTLSSWKNEGKGIFSKTVSCETKPNFILINDIWYAMGRYPNNSYLTYESFLTNVSITDDQLSGNSNWTGAEAVIRKNDWTLDRCSITNHTNTRISYKSNGTSLNGTANYGYFIQNHINTLDVFGEWYYDGDILYVYFGSESPDDHVVKVSTVNNLITITRKNYITIENIDFTGAGGSAVFLESYASNCVIQGCNIDYSGENGIKLLVTRYCKVNNNQINHSIKAGIWGDSNNWNIITDNTITNSGMILGADNTGVQTVGIYSNYCNDELIQYNRIDSSSYNGIFFRGDRTKVKNNYIKNSLLLLNDGGGIYTNNKIFAGRVIEGNIILNSVGNADGSAKSAGIYAEGIYLDAPSTNIELRNNTIAYCKRSGIFFHEAHNNICTGNTLFDNAQQVRFQYGSIYPNDNIRNNVFRDNVLISKTPSFLSLWARSSLEDIPNFITADNNYYARPVDDSNVFYTYSPSTGAKYRSLAGWQSFTRQDANSKKSPVTLKDSSLIEFYYNETKINKNISLKQPMIDVKGNKYASSITLLPFTSAVLMIDPSPTMPVVPIYEGSIIENETPNILEITFSVNLMSEVLPSVSAFNVMVNGVSRNVITVVISGNRLRLTLSNPVAYGDTITIGYVKPDANQLRSISGGICNDITAQAVTNNLLEPITANAPPVIVLKYQSSAFSGLIYEIDASGSYDPDHDKLNFEWMVPDNIPVSSRYGPKIRFLSPVVTRSQLADFRVTVSDGRMSRGKDFTINISPYKPELNFLQIQYMEASSFNLNNYPTNAIDGNLATKWSAEGENQWLLFRLAKPSRINHIQLSFLTEQQYESFFDVYVSRDNIIWEPVFIKTTSCNFSGASQVFDFPAEKNNIEYSYIKLIGRGNSSNKWNHFTEFKLFGNPNENYSPSALNSGNISIYPNPASEYINVLILEPPPLAQTLSIFDLYGKLYLESRLDQDMNYYQIPLNLRMGVYVLQVMMESYVVFTQKLIVTE